MLRSNLTQACRRLVALLGGVLLLGLAAQAQAAPADNFITTWRATANDAITFPGEGSYTIDWGDGSAIATATGAINHTYAAAGDYDIAASNTITRFHLNNGADREKLIDIKQWGSAEWSSMENAFYGAFNMRMSATDAPDLSAVGTMRGMFEFADAFNGDISGWDVGNVKNMALMFRGAYAFNGDISGWDVGDVKNMASMFRAATAFNQDIGGWEVDKVEYMSLMFSAAAAFNRDISGWDVSNVMDMNNMFRGAATFSQNLGRWYIVGTTNLGYDGAADFVVLNLAAQNRFLTDQDPVYALAAGDGDSGNNKFTLTGAALSAKADTAAGDYSVRIGASGVDFGAANARAITVAVPATGTATLSGLALAPGTLDPVFASTTTSYSASVANAVASITVTPTTTGSDASFVISGTAADGNSALTVSNGLVSGLTVGANAISIAVTAEDTTTQTYTVAVARAASSDATLSGLALSAGSLDPVFASTTTSYHDQLQRQRRQRGCEHHGHADHNRQRRQLCHKRHRGRR